MLIQKAISPIMYYSIETRQEVEIEGEKIIDFTAQVFSEKKSVEFNDAGASSITSEFEGKPNLVALALYADQNVADSMLFYNEISNPFSISSDMVILMPNIADAVGAIDSQTNELQKNKKNKSQTELNKKINIQDKKRIMELIKQNNKSVVVPNIGENGINDAGIDNQGNIATFDEFIKSPNMTTDDQLKIVDGKVILGSNISNRRCSDKSTKTQGLSISIRQSIIDKIKSGEI